MTVESTVEQIVGITSFLSPSPQAVPLSLDRSLPENFQVSEILPQGEVLSNDEPTSFLASPELGLFVQGILTKRSVDTPGAVTRLAKELNVPRHFIGYAGLKDSNAVTKQRISVFNPTLDPPSEVDLGNIQLTQLCQKRYEVRLGDLGGNFFEVILTPTLRDNDLSDDLVSELQGRAGLVQKQGFPNFFGLQRFGGQRPLTHIMGRLLLQKRWEDAVKVYLTTSSLAEPTHLQEARRELALTWDLPQFLRSIPSRFRYERGMSQVLVKNQTNYWKALNTIPKRILRLFVGGFQSFIFNRTLSNVLLTSDDPNTIHGSLPLPGYHSNLGEEPLLVQESILTVLAESGVELADFSNREMPWLRVQGGRRNVVVHAFNLDLAVAGESVRLSFGLPKGSYATMLVRELLGGPGTLKFDRLAEANFLLFNHELQ